MAEQSGNNLQHVEQLLRDGNKQGALALLAAYLQANPNSAQGWWLLSFAIPDEKKQIDCVERVLHIDPNYKPAHARLAKLKGKVVVLPTVPPFVETISLKPAVISPQLSKEDSHSAVLEQPSVQEKKSNQVLQYSMLAIMGLIAVGILALAVVMIAQSGLLTRPVMPNSFTQISLPPTWTLTPIATRTATQAPFQATATPTVAPVSIVPTSTIPRSQIGPASGYYAPNFSLSNVSNNVPTSLSDYEGKLVIIFFWATWCQVCKGEMPAVQMIYEAYKDQGLTVLAVDVGENASMARNYRDAHLLTFPILDDAGRDVSSKYQVTAFPTFFFVDPSGVISSVTVGGMGYWGYDKKVKAMLNIQ